MVHLVYQAYGSEEILAEACFSILSLFQLHPQRNFRVAVYTDQPDFFKSKLKAYLESIDLVTTSLDTFKKWRGKIDFVHRVKLEMLKDFFARFDSDLLYLDSDIVIKEPLDHILNNIATDQAVYMHVDEGRICDKANPIMKKMNKFLKRNTFIIKGQSISISPKFSMWNAGVIGLNKKHSGLIDEMISLTDQMYQIYQKHVMEQFAVSYFLQTCDIPLKDCEKEIYHYWNFKNFRSHILNFFEQNTQDLVLPKPWDLAPPPKLSLLKKFAMLFK